MTQSKGGKGKGMKSSKAPSSKGKGSKGGKVGKGKKSSKAPSSKGKGGKGGKGKNGKSLKCKGKKNRKSKGSKGKKSSKHPKSKGEGGKSCEKTPTVSPTEAPTVSPTEAPTNICKLTDVERIDGIRDIIKSVSNLEDLDTPGTAQNMAYSWLISEESSDLFVCPDDSTFVLQRYVLAVVYYATKGQEWDRCNQGAEECFSVKKGVRTDHEPYLSKANVCEWFGVSCINDSIVISIQLGEYF